VDAAKAVFVSVTGNDPTALPSDPAPDTIQYNPYLPDQFGLDHCIITDSQSTFMPDELLSSGGIIDSLAGGGLELPADFDWVSSKIQEI
jgi:hypothetical protein